MEYAGTSGCCYSAVLSGQWLGSLAFAVDPAYDYFARLFVASVAVELEQPQIIAVGSFLFRRGGEVCSELAEQLAERFEVFVRLGWFLFFRVMSV